MKGTPVGPIMGQAGLEYLEAQPQIPPKPNILIILADDLGYGDLKSYNPDSRIPTPHLDKLAAEGIRLTNAYCPVSVCSPSRYALMTGRYPWRSWKKSGVMANYEPSMIDSNDLTIPDMLRQSGYVTSGYGKWHLGATFPTLDGMQPAGYGKFQADDNGANIDIDGPVKDGPLDRGFDKWLGFSCPSECWILKDNSIVGAIPYGNYTIAAAPKSDNLKIMTLENYLSFLTDEAVTFLEEHNREKEGKPFFLYFAPYVPHIPLSVSGDFRGKTQAGLYGDYVHEMDHHLGKILNTLDSLNLAENTIVLFASDNGSQFRVTGNKIDMSNAKNAISQSEEGELDNNLHRPNGSLRGTKWTAWEGGVRTPFIARWPGHFPAGAASDQLLALNDVLATLAAIIKYDIGDSNTLDSYNLLPVLRGEDRVIRESVVVQSSNEVFGLRWRNWKFIKPSEKSTEKGARLAGELYDLSKDISESENLYEKYPKVVKKMEKMLQENIEAGKN